MAYVIGLATPEEVKQIEDAGYETCVRQLGAFEYCENTLKNLGFVEVSVFLTCSVEDLLDFDRPGEDESSHDEASLAETYGRLLAEAHERLLDAGNRALNTLRVIESLTPNTHIKGAIDELEFALKGDHVITLPCDDCEFADGCIIQPYTEECNRRREIG